MLKQDGAVQPVDAGIVPLEPAQGDNGDAATNEVTDPAVHDQLARDLAEIEAATAALRKAEPDLESWTRIEETAVASKPRSVWLLVGALWLSTVLVVAVAVVAIANFAG
jgi:hypothetical protein